MISNDSDLKFPVQTARDRVPVGTVNPSRNLTAGKLRGSPADGVGNHWWLPAHGGRFPGLPAPRPGRRCAETRAMVSCQPPKKGNCVGATRVA